MQAGTSFKVTVRSNLPLTQMLPSQQAALPSPFSRAVFLFDYADSELLHSLESTIRAVNAQCLGLHKSPGALAAQAKAASVAGSLPADTGMVRLMQACLQWGICYLVRWTFFPSSIPQLLFS